MRTNYHSTSRRTAGIRREARVQWSPREQPESHPEPEVPQRFVPFAPSVQNKEVPTNPCRLLMVIEELQDRLWLRRQLNERGIEQ